MMPSDEAKGGSHVVPEPYDPHISYHISRVPKGTAILTKFEVGGGFRRHAQPMLTIPGLSIPTRPDVPLVVTVPFRTAC